MGNYRKLEVWKRAQRFASEVYRCTRSFPDCEQFGLTAQLRRSATAIASNIAEGSGRGTDKDQVRFLTNARGSVCEIECQLLLSRDVGYLESDTWKTLDSDCREIGRMLNGLIRTLRQNARPQ
jgi:four helix bundle protein